MNCCSIIWLFSWVFSGVQFLPLALISMLLIHPLRILRKTVVHIINTTLQTLFSVPSTPNRRAIICRLDILSVSLSMLGLPCMTPLRFAQPIVCCNQPRPLVTCFMFLNGSDGFCFFFSSIAFFIVYSKII